MPQCIKCKEFFPPNYTEIIPESEPEFSRVSGKMEYPQHCVFCKEGVDFVTRESSHNSGDFNTKYTKDEVIADYKAYVQKMKTVADKKQLEKLLKDNPFGLG
jgi:hypothetical protein